MNWITSAIEMLSLINSNDALNDATELRHRLEQDGYLFFRRLIEPDRLWDLRKEMLEVMQSCGWILPGTHLMDGITVDGVQCTEGDLEYSHVYHQVYKLQSFHEVAHCPEVMSTVETIRGCQMLPQPQKVARLWFPKFTDHTTPTHQDFVHFQGSSDNLTCWSPIGDCPHELGGLAILKGSHKVNRVLNHHFSLGAGSLHVDPTEHVELGDQWLTTDYQAGDTLVFPALTVHKALPNLTEDRLRISLDNRYQRVSEPIAEHMLGPHLNSIQPITWEQVYEAWSNDELKYYWKKHNLTVLPRITDYLDQGFEEAIALAKSGDPQAQLHLRRTLLKAEKTEQSLRAAKILKTLKT
ncbi:MAG: phytanoyl-CoA dioxygenase family protein [Planctomycetota bacterium]|nr:phytanoyl-CoA dioxygenase family protein [Planctomycetota bacterium]